MDNTTEFDPNDYPEVGAVKEAYPACAVMPLSRMTVNETAVNNGDANSFSVSFFVRTTKYSTYRRRVTYCLPLLYCSTNLSFNCSSSLFTRIAARVSCSHSLAYVVLTHRILVDENNTAVHSLFLGLENVGQRYPQNERASTTVMSAIGWNRGREVAQYRVLVLISAARDIEALCIEGTLVRGGLFDSEGDDFSGHATASRAYSLRRLRLQHPRPRTIFQAQCRDNGTALP